MVKSLDEIPYGQMPRRGQTARLLINTQKKNSVWGLNQKTEKAVE